MQHKLSVPEKSIVVILYELVLAAITIPLYVLVIQVFEQRGGGVFVFCLLLINVIVCIVFWLLG